ncbi:conserved protein [Tepidicaulis marinus]|jgi:predicted secreted protein|uniref:Conserved protein n=1 Tax=Tepidicaulis marinus TaxID=1333998 RepID=A0A081B934_9HYPH|nr:DUF1467 family protein [Tepidicaulis marinus]GAK44552.1 conserved protein [Tepidicaulis marinus]
MSLTDFIQAAAIYAVIWWLVLFAVLPWGVRSQGEMGQTVPGTEDGAPVRPLLLRKVIATTIAAAVIYLAVHWLLYYSGMTLDDIPFFPKFEPVR